MWWRWNTESLIQKGLLYTHTEQNKLGWEDKVSHVTCDVTRKEEIFIKKN